MKRVIIVMLAVFLIFSTTGQALAAVQKKDPCQRKADGSKKHPYMLCMEDDLALLHANPAAHFVLAKDISLTKYFPTVPSFSGQLDGQYHSIKNLQFGFFGTIEKGATVKKLRLKEINLSGDRYGPPVAGLAQSNYGTITNSSVSGLAGSYYGAGGLVVINYGTIHKSAFIGGVGGGNYSAGGLAIDNAEGGVISNSYSDAKVSGVIGAGGIVANNNGLIINCTAYGDVTGYVHNIGGLVGANNATGQIVNSKAYGDIHIQSYTADYGLLTGVNSGTVIKSAGYGTIISN